MDLHYLCTQSLLFLVKILGLLFSVLISTYIMCREYNENTYTTIFMTGISKRQIMRAKLITIFEMILFFMSLTFLELLFISIVTGHGIDVVQFVSWLYFFIKAAVFLFLSITVFAYLALLSKCYILPIVSCAVVLMIRIILSGAGGKVDSIFPWSIPYYLTIGNLERQTSTVSPLISLAILLLIGLIPIFFIVRFFDRRDI